MENRKLRIGFVSNCPVGGKTGLAKNMRFIIPLLWQTDKYEIFFLAQGMPDNDVNFNKLPFKVEGALKEFNQDQFHKDQNYQRLVAYGNTAIRGFVERNKLDCLVLSDDIWAFSNDCYLNTDWFQHMKQNVLPIITADSEFLLPQIKEWAEKCPNMKFWSSFAERSLKAENPEKFKHCGVIYGAVKTEEFKPLFRHERLPLRQKFGIADDEKVCIYLGRNQLRKIFASHMEGLAKFKKRNPNKKFKLLFHCSWGKEPGGWPLDHLRQNYGLNREDVLATYYCQKCGNWNIQPFHGEDLDCHECNTQHSRVTAGIGSPINEEDLNKIYNVADCSASIFTSGSFEYTNPESMLAGLPLAVPNYVCGEDFLKSGVVYEIKGTHTWESSTGFLKFVPNTNSVCDFFEYIYDLPESKRQEIVQKGRKFAIENFDSKNVVNKYMEFFDSRSPIDWEPYFDKKKELKNPNAEVTDVQDDVEFVRECYKKILNCPDVEKSDNTGFNHWLKFLKQPIDKAKLKNDMINVFRNAAMDHNRRNNPVPFETELIKNNKKNLLIVLKESIGDIVLSSALLSSFRRNYPKENWNIYYATKPEYFSIIEGNSNIDKILPFQDFMDNEILCTGAGKMKGYFNAYCHLGVSSQKFLNYLTNSSICLPKCEIGGNSCI